MEKNTLIAVISLGFISVTALVLSIIGVASNGHSCGLEKGEMMKRGNMMQGQNPGQRFDINKPNMRLPGSGAIPPAQAMIE